MDSIIGPIPFMTRIYLATSVFLMALCSLDIISPLNLYMSWTLVFQGEIWRVVTCFVYFGSFGMIFFWNIYVLIHYCSSLESVTMQNKPADFLWMLICTGTMLLGLSQIFGHSMFYGGTMINILTYIWGRKNPYSRVGIVFLSVPAPYLPWILTILSYLADYLLNENLLGILVGHVYYFFTDVFPKMPISGGRQIFATPEFLKYLLNQYA
ncbi:Derl-like family member protein [Theileria equi strain WA]|uniref:Derlin n=1 Tax=Theileria equi strain WA TaxID=1537102 RepID=L0AVF9_THEEQ|nr:Derl-like family member protein [Theileria equi strain WA]AFZ79001.1 Derl-like family member protein [Theileria equi strain WA]|eukprot:XP_004828667.1 Derl-like family member protein [Theileria equi strain WA]